MSTYPRLVSFFAFAIGLWACGPQDLTTPQLHSPIDETALRPEQALQMFYRLGCIKPESGSKTEREVVLPTPNGDRYTLSCSGVSTDAIARASAEYYRQFSAGSDEMPLEMAAPGYAYVTVYYTCEVETTWEYWPEWGDWVIVDQSVNWCHTWRVYHNEGGGTGGWAGGSGGQTNPPIEPPNPPDPAPGDSMTTEDLNAMEVLRCIGHPLECADYRSVSIEALAWSRSMTNGSIANNIYDARRHAYWSLRLTEEIGAESAEIWTDLHEWNSRAMYESCMDKFNNDMGRTFAAEIQGLHLTTAQKQAYVIANDNRLQSSPAC